MSIINPKRYQTASDLYGQLDLAKRQLEQQDYLREVDSRIRQQMLDTYLTGPMVHSPEAQSAYQSTTRRRKLLLL